MKEGKRLAQRAEGVAVGLIAGRAAPKLGLDKQKEGGPALPGSGSVSLSS